SGRRAQDAPSVHLSARKDRTCSPLVFRTVNHADRRKSMGPDPRALAAVSELQDIQLKSIEDALEKVNKAANRRNRLVHGSWEFMNDKFQVTTYQPNNKNPEKSEVVTEKSVLELASDYRAAGLFVEAAASSLLTSAMERNTSTTASSGSPEQS
ncbi:hypothetical protein, partial [Marinovum algicola]